jgi:hypothetical protein
MVDNFEQVKGLLVFPRKDSFYFLQILQRKKDHKGERLGGSNNNSRLIKAYYITSKEKLDIHREEIVRLCEVFGARASINLNPRSFEKTAFQLLVKVANQMHNKAYHDVAKAYNSVCGDYQAEMDRRWLIDIDTQDKEYIHEVSQFVSDLQSEIHNKEYSILAVIPSKNGAHIITNPFNLERFNTKYPTLEVHKNNPTNLYIV